ncbi:MAG TPA: alpha/beta hydrolase, partial [Gemmataceae bacterium]|nr:alpha/beta hydrolase [Gemmataceae bacterium]
MNAGRFAIAVLLAGFGGVLAFAPAQERVLDTPAAQLPAAEPLGVTKTANIAYRDDEDADPERHRLDVYAPQGQKGFPVLFFVHGGTWKSGNKNLYAALGNTFARTGIGVVIINYRLSPKVVHPAHVEDVARAFAWTREHIREYGG